MKKFSNWVYSLLNSRGFLLFILIFFLFEAAWIAVSAAYPQAFDENFHFGLIKIYSHHWSPFLSSQPAGGNQYGAVARDPSYLYHYLMSFPYRVIDTFVHGTIRQVITLRFINILLFAVGLILFRKILLRAKVSKSLANVSILLFTLIPIVPQLAAQINYDNLLFPLVAWSVLLGFDLIDQLKKKKPSSKTIITIASVCLLASLVKYAFLPIFLVLGVFLLVILHRNFRHNYGGFFKKLLTDWKRQSVKIKFLLIAMFVIALGLFIQRDVVNLVKYHSVEPSCSAVLNVSDCKAYSVWDYNYTQHISFEKYISDGHQLINPISYTVEWVYWMWYRLFFAVNGPVSSFTNYPPLPLPSAAAILLIGAGIFLFFKYWRQIFDNNIYLVLLFCISLVYLLVLFAQGYSTYHYTGVLENMNGRYLLPITLLAIAIFARSLSIGLKNHQSLKTILVCAVLLLFLQGGGLFTFIARSDDTWDLQNPTVEKVNNTARKITNPIILNGNKNYSTSYWFFN